MYMKSAYIHMKEQKVKMNEDSELFKKKFNFFVRNIHSCMCTWKKCSNIEYLILST